MYEDDIAAISAIPANALSIEDRRELLALLEERDRRRWVRLLDEATARVNASLKEAKQRRKRVVCGARRKRDGLPCEAKSEPGMRRCRHHGGCSTGPKTPEGKARALANLRRPAQRAEGSGQ